MSVFRSHCDSAEVFHLHGRITVARLRRCLKTDSRESNPVPEGYLRASRFAEQAVAIARMPLDLSRAGEFTAIASDQRQPTGLRSLPQDNRPTVCVVNSALELCIVSVLSLSQETLASPVAPHPAKETSNR
ncbi:hypothetical protein B7486_10950 [cyanobacterium TDX16]|nr:hypothetical protein B7486_10950 [cyanobacterium TDX16]